MARIKILRTYRFMDKDPVIDEIRTALQDERLMERLGIAADLASLSPSTLRNWFHGDTRKPQFASAMAIMSSIGYEHKWVRGRRVDVDSELKVARAWLAKNRAEAKQKRSKGKTKKQN